MILDLSKKQMLAETKFENRKMILEIGFRNDMKTILEDKEEIYTWIKDIFRGEIFQISSNGILEYYFREIDGDNKEVGIVSVLRIK
jgi:hypothetical protein